MSIIGDVSGLTGLPQKILLGVFGAALVAAGGYNVVQAIENRHLSSEYQKLDKQIHDPATGYVVKLTQAETNTQTCSAAVGQQNAAIRAQSQKDSVTIAAVQARYDTEHAARVKAEKSAAVFLAHKPQGATEAARVADVDAQVLGDLK